jgi:hypothetical protein
MEAKAAPISGNAPERVRAPAVWPLLACTLAVALAACRDGDEPEASVPEPGVPAEPAAPAPSAPAPPAPPPVPSDLVVEDAGFATPESVLHDPAADIYLVSNINGGPSDADDNGFISRIKPDGTVDKLKWIDAEQPGVTLHAPKGMAIAAGLLHVADIKVVRMFDAVTGEPKGDITIPGASFLNDLAVGPDGVVYVSDTGVRATPKGFEDTGSDAVYKIVGKRPAAVIRGKTLGRPNGLLADASGVWVVTFGTGEMYRVDTGKRAEVQKLPKGSLDGIVKTKKGLFLVSSWEGEYVALGAPGGNFDPVVTKVKAPADIGYDARRDRVLVPLFMDNAVKIVGL